MIAFSASYCHAKSGGKDDKIHSAARVVSSSCDAAETVAADSWRPLSVHNGHLTRYPSCRVPACTSDWRFGHKDHCAQFCAHHQTLLIATEI
jgi:hypothetical protein